MNGIPAVTSNDLAGVMTQLANVRPYHGGIPGRGQHGVDRTARLLNAIAAGTLLLIAVPLLLMYAIDSTSTWAKTLGLIFGIAGAFLAFLAVALQIAWGFCLLLQSKKVRLTISLLETDVDEAHAKALCAFPRDTLHRAEQHLSMHLSRAEKHVALFLGDNAALISTFALAIAVANDASLDSVVVRAVNSSNPLSGDWILIYAFSLVLGLALGAILFKKEVARLRYQLEILALALRSCHLPDKDPAQ